MNEEVEIKFEREDLSGIVAVGTYLSDAAKRMGVDLEGEQFDEENYNIVKIVKGGELLSAPTKEEKKKLADDKRAEGERLANHAKIERAGEIIIMTTEKKAEEKPKEEEIKEEYRKEFEALPLEKKIASLVELEAIALGETFTFILNSPYKIVGKVMDVMAEFGLKLEDDAKKQTRPAEHQNGDEDKNGKKDAESSVKKTDETESVVEAVTDAEENSSANEDKKNTDGK